MAATSNVYLSLKHINFDCAIIIGTDILAERGFPTMIDIRFPTALQIMLSLALAEEQSVSHLSSSLLAESLGANPSFVRKLLVPLVQSKLLCSQMGKAGGVRLARPAAEITLRDIYRAVVADTKIWAPRTGIPHRCLVSSNVQGYFEELIDDAQESILSMLGQRTLLQALTELERRDSAKRHASKVRLSVQNKR
jgi:Rrf2 family transcriptional repressor of oqxAB